MKPKYRPLAQRNPSQIMITIAYQTITQWIDMLIFAPLNLRIFFLNFIDHSPRTHKIVLYRKAWRIDVNCLISILIFISKRNDVVVVHIINQLIILLHRMINELILINWIRIKWKYQCYHAPYWAISIRLFPAVISYQRILLIFHLFQLRNETLKLIVFVNVEKIMHLNKIIQNVFIFLSMYFIK